VAQSIIPMMPCPRCDGHGKIPDGRGLADIRSRLGLTGTALAKKLGVSAVFVFNVETGVSPMPPSMYEKLTALYGNMSEIKGGK